MEMFNLKIPRRLIFTSILIFGILILVIVLTTIVIQGKSKIQAALEISQQNREQLQRTESVNEALLNVEIRFKEYCTSFDKNLFAAYRSEVETLSQNIKQLQESEQGAISAKTGQIDEILDEKEKEGVIFARLKQLSDSLIFSVDTLNMFQESIVGEFSTYGSERIDTLSITHTEESYRNGLLGRLRDALVGGKTQKNTNTKILVQSTAEGVRGRNGSTRDGFHDSEDSEWGAALAKANYGLKVSEINLLIINNRLINSIREIVDEINISVKKREEIRNKTFLTSVVNSTDLLHYVLIILMIIAISLLSYLLYLAYQNQKTQDEIVALNEKIHHNSLEKDKFFSVLAHDLKNPFNALLGFSDILKETINTGTKEDATEYAEIVHDSAKRVYNLLQSLLVWSRVNDGKIEYSASTVRLKEFVSENMKIMAPIAEKKEIDFNWRVSGDADVELDKNMINSVLQNLVTNAIKFTPRKGKVNLKATIKNNHIRFIVSDTGIGIPELQLSKIFSLHKNYRSIGTDNEEGTGLGLVISKEFIELHGGRIWVESKLGLGSQFYFEIPVKRSVGGLFLVEI